MMMTHEISYNNFNNNSNELNYTMDMNTSPSFSRDCIYQDDTVYQGDSDDANEIQSRQSRQLKVYSKGIKENVIV